ncbi:MAG: phosphoribosylformylglycinamidine synthase subunit PurL, partial [Actinomycetota bacterium]|nr:phosphoribosylformylglycinamidine synthase subunit PurL [Actinomycetota bacterium]
SAFLEILHSPEIASKRWVWEQYDHMIFLGTIEGPGGDAAVIRLTAADQDVAVAISVDGPGRYCQLDPYEGARLAVAEAARNVACSGGRPLAITNCLNFGNPEKPEVMWQFSEAVRGIGDAALALSTPVTGGNVSFYNETNGRPIYPTPVIGMLGVLHSAEQAVGMRFRETGDVIILAGETDENDFGGSDYAKTILGVVAGRPPRLDLDKERKLLAFLYEAAGADLLASAHDASGGGLGIALAESAIAGGIGFKIDLADGEPHRILFSESPSRAIISCRPEKEAEVIASLGRHGVATSRLGIVGGALLDFEAFEVPLADAAKEWEETLARILSASAG